MNDKTMFLCDPTRKAIGRIAYDGEKFQISIDKEHPSLLEELKQLLSKARQDGVTIRITQRLPQEGGGELVTESVKLIKFGDESFWEALKDTINATKTFSEGRVFAIIPKAKEGKQ